MICAVGEKMTMMRVTSRLDTAPINNRVKYLYTQNWCTGTNIIQPPGISILLDALRKQVGFMF